MRRRQMGPSGLALPPLARSAIIIMAVNAVVWISFILLMKFSSELPGEVAHMLFLDPQLVTEGYLHQLATYMFFHDLDSPIHLLMTLLLVYFFATPLESRWGIKKTLWFTFGAGVAGGVMVVLFHLISLLIGFGPGNLTIGFSGAALGMLAAFCTLNSDAEILLFFIIPIKARHIIPLTIGVDLLFWVAPGSNISFAAHLGGLLFGILVAGGIGLPMRRIRYWKIKRELKKRKKSGKESSIIDGPWLN